MLRHAPGQRMVLLTREGDRLLTSRLFLHPVKLALGGLVEEVTVTGEGSIGGLPETVTLALEGYRVRAGLGEIAGLPAVVSAGVTRDVGSFLAPPDDGLGYAYVSTEFIAGETLAQVGEQLATGEKLALMRRLLRLVSRLHERRVVYGDLKPHNVIAVGDQPWLIDLDTMRRVPRADLAIPTRDLTPSYAAPEQMSEHLTYLASDVYSLARLGLWLLDAELSATPPDPAAATWQPRFERALVDEPADRPTAEALVAESGLSEQAQDDDPALTVPVLDILDAGGDETETVQAWAGIFSGNEAHHQSKNRAARERDGDGDGDHRPANEPMVFRALSPRLAADDDSAGESAAAPGPSQRAATELVTPRRRNTHLVLIALATFLAIAAVLAGAFLAPAYLAGGGPNSDIADAAPPPDAGPPPFHHCDDDATRVILAYLTPDDPIPPPSELLSWFAAVPAEEVEIARFRHEDTDRRFVSFELSQAGFSDWESIADGALGVDRCTRLGHELAARDLGPPEGPYRTRDHDYRFLARRPDRVVDLEPLGDLRGIANGDAYAATLDWLSPLDVEVVQCRARGGWLTRSALEVDCAVENPRERTTAVEVTARMVRDGSDPVEEHHRVVLDPEQRVELPFTFGDFDDSAQTYCDCQAETLP